MTLRAGDESYTPVPFAVGRSDGFLRERGERRAEKVRTQIRTAFLTPSETGAAIAGFLGSERGISASTSLLVCELAKRSELTGASPLACFMSRAGTSMALIVAARVTGERQQGRKKLRD